MAMHWRELVSQNTHTVHSHAKDAPPSPLMLDGFSSCCCSLSFSQKCWVRAEICLEKGKGRSGEKELERERERDGERIE